MCVCAPWPAFPFDFQEILFPFFVSFLLFSLLFSLGFLCVSPAAFSYLTGEKSSSTATKSKLISKHKVFTKKRRHFFGGGESEDPCRCHRKIGFSFQGTLEFEIWSFGYRDWGPTGQLSRFLQAAPLKLKTPAAVRDYKDALVSKALTFKP